MAVVALAATTLSTGCRTAATPAPAAATGEAPGAATSSEAVERFLAAARTPEPSRMAQLFGTASGPVAARDPAEDVERRMRALACYLAHDRALVIQDVVGVGSGRAVTVELRQGELVRRPVFQTVQGPRGRWFVSSFDINALSDFCRAR